MKFYDQTDSRELSNIREMIKEIEMPIESYSEQIMMKIGENRMLGQKHRVARKALIAASVTAVLGAGIIGSGFVSPAMADALKQIPLLSSVFENSPDKDLQAAVQKGLVTQPNLSITHNGVSLKISDVMYDGSRLTVAIQRDGVQGIGMISPYADERAEIVLGDIKKVPKEQQKKGYLQQPSILINNVPLNINHGSFGDYVGQDNTALFEVTAGLSEAKVPDEFELTLETNVTGVQEPFVFKIPVKKALQQSLVLNPNVSKSKGEFSYTVKQIEIRGVSTRLITASEGPVPNTPEQSGKYIASKMYYDLFDDQGKLIPQNSIGYFNRKPGTKYHEDELYSAIPTTAQSITVKPYTFTVNPENWGVVGKDQTHLYGKKTYHKELEITIPIERK